MKLKLRPRSVNPSLAIALIALFVSLSGTAVAAGVVPLAKRALVANNAKRLGGKTAVQVARLAPKQHPTLIYKTQPFSLSGGAQQDFTTTCAGGQKAIAGGYDNPIGTAVPFDTRPTPDRSGWMLYLLNGSDTIVASGTLYAVCLR